MEWRLLNGKRGRIVQIDNGVISFTHFNGEADEYHRDGDRDFLLTFSDEEFAEALMNDVNEYGVAWNVKVKNAVDDGDLPRMSIKVKAKYRMVNGRERGPEIYLVSGKNVILLNSENIGILDDIEIDHVDADIIPYDKITNGKPYRTAYVKKMYVVQVEDRFVDRYNNY